MCTNKRKKRIYIAGALNAGATDYIQNMHRMIRWAEIARKAGFSVYVPCTDFLCGLVNGNLTYGDYFDNSQPWLLASDAVIIIPDSEGSSGVRREKRLAEDNGIPVFHIDNENAVHKMRTIYERLDRKLR